MSIKSVTCLPTQIGEIQNWLNKNGCNVRSNSSKYVSWAGTLGHNYITLYTSGKIVFDTKDQDGFELLVQFEKVFTQYDKDSCSTIYRFTSGKKCLNKKSSKALFYGTLEVTETPYCIALDESGTGEAFGRVILSGCLISRQTQLVWQDHLQKINTKGGGKKGEDYWFEQQSKILNWQLASDNNDVPIDYQNLVFALENELFVRVGIKNKLMDKYYQKQMVEPLLIEYTKKCSNLTQLTIIIDNYALGKDFKSYLQDLENKGVTIIVATKADDKYMAVRLAAIQARIQRAQEIKDFNEPKFMVCGILPGNGNLSVPQTKKWLSLWWKKHNSWPWFVKQWFKPTQVVSGIFFK